MSRASKIAAAAGDLGKIGGLVILRIYGWRRPENGTPGYPGQRGAMAAWMLFIARGSASPPYGTTSSMGWEQHRDGRFNKKRQDF